MAKLNFGIYCLLLVEMTIVFFVVLARRYLSGRWQRSIFAVSNRYGKYSLVAAALASLLFLDSYFEVKKLERQTYRQVTDDHSTRLQYNADKAFAQRNMYISGVDVYLAVILWLLLGIDTDTVGTQAIRPANPPPAPDTSQYQQLLDRLSTGANISTMPPAKGSPIGEHPHFKATINAPTTESAMHDSHVRESSTTKPSMLLPRRSESLEMDPRSLREVYEASRQVDRDVGDSTRDENEDDDSLQTDPRSLREIQDVFRRGQGDRGSSSAVEFV